MSTLRLHYGPLTFGITHYCLGESGRFRGGDRRPHSRNYIFFPVGGLPLCSAILRKLFYYNPEKPFDLVLSHRRAGNDYRIRFRSVGGSVFVYRNYREYWIYTVGGFADKVRSHLGTGPIYARLEQ